MGKQIFVRVDTFFTVFKLQAGDTQIVDLVLLCGGQIAFQINKASFVAEFFQCIVKVEFRQNFNQFMGCFFGIKDFARVGIKVSGWQRSRDNGSVAVNDVGATDRIGRIDGAGIFLFFAKGKTLTKASKICCGDIGVATKLGSVKTGDTLGLAGKVTALKPMEYAEPCYTMAIYAKVKGQEDKIASGLSKLNEEDLSFHYGTNTETKEMIISGVGDIHLGVICSKLLSKFKVEAELRPAKIAYRETIKKKVEVHGRHKKQSGGHGQFGDVWIEFEPQEEQEDMMIPSELIPRCPICGSPMTMNLRVDDTFVQDFGWYEAAKRYDDFIESHSRSKVLYLELGVGFNTPGIIKYPFWNMTVKNRNAHYACVNLGEAYFPEQLGDRALGLDMDIGDALRSLGERSGIPAL